MSGGLGPGEVRAAPSTPKTKRRRAELSRIAREADHAAALEGLRKRRQEAAEKNNNGEVSKTQDGAKVTADSAIRDETVTQNGVVGAESDEKNVGSPDATTAADAGPAIDSSMMLIANFKRRPRQPSILRMVRAEQGKKNDDGEQTDGDDLDFTLGQDELGPEDQSTPFNIRQYATLGEAESSDSDADEIEIGRDASRVDGHRSTHDQVSASALQVHDDTSPKPRQLLPPWSPEPAAKETRSEGVEPFPQYVDPLAQPASPESQRAATPDTIRDSPKGSSEEDTAFEQDSPPPNEPNTSKKRKSDGLEDASKGIKNKKALSTDALRDMLPRRRRPVRKTRRQVVDDEGLEVDSAEEMDSDDEEVDDVQDEDYVHGIKRQRRGAANARSKRGTAKNTLPKGDNSGALQPPRGVARKINGRKTAKAQRSAKAAASKPPTTMNGHRLSPSHSVLGSSDKENHFGPRRLPRGKAGKGQGKEQQPKEQAKGLTNPDQGKGRKRVLQPSRLATPDGDTTDDPDSDDAEPETTPTKRRRLDISPAPQRDLNTDVPLKKATSADELAETVNKFKKVDEWELCFEDDTGPSVTPPAPSGVLGTPVAAADAAQQSESRQTPDAPWSAFSINTAIEYNPPPSPSPAGPRRLGGQQQRRQSVHTQKYNRQDATVNSPAEMEHHEQAELAISSLDDQLSPTTGAAAEEPRGRVTRASKNEAGASGRALSDGPTKAAAAATKKTTTSTRGRVSKNTTARGKTTQDGSKKPNAGGKARSGRTTTGSGANTRGKGRARGGGK